MCLKNTGFWDMTQCWLVLCYRRFVRALCLRLQSTRKKISCCENTPYYYSSTVLKMEAVRFSETSVTNQHGVIPGRHIFISNAVKCSHHTFLWLLLPRVLRVPLLSGCVNRANSLAPCYVIISVLLLYCNCFF